MYINFLGGLGERNIFLTFPFGAMVLVLQERFNTLHRPEKHKIFLLFSFNWKLAFTVSSQNIMQITQELIVQVTRWPDISLPGRPGSMFSAQLYEYFKFALLMVSITYLQFKTLVF